MSVINEYKTSRKIAKMSQMKAARLLNISQKTLSGYENGQRVPEDVVAKMAEIYRNPGLLTSYCRECPIGKKLGDKSCASELSAITVQLKNQRRIFDGVIDGMIDYMSKLIFPVSMDIKRAAPVAAGVAQ